MTMPVLKTENKYDVLTLFTALNNAFVKIAES